MNRQPVIPTRWPQGSNRVLGRRLVLSETEQRGSSAPAGVVCGPTQQLCPVKFVSGSAWPCCTRRPRWTRGRCRWRWGWWSGYWTRWCSAKLTGRVSQYWQHWGGEERRGGLLLMASSKTVCGMAESMIGPEEQGWDNWPRPIMNCLHIFSASLQTNEW